MRIVTISDTHTFHDHLTSNANFPNKLPDGDLLIHAGDFSSTGKKGEVEDFTGWLTKISHKYTYGIVFIAGNHDRSFDPKFNYENNQKTKPTWLVDIIHDIESGGRICYLENSSTIINGVKIWGSPITPWFHGDRWAFNRYRGEEIRKVWSNIPNDTNIVVTHGPVAYKCDFTQYDKLYVGCEELRTKCKEVKPLLHISGHIHEGYGYEYDEDTTYINTSICNLNYNPINKPWVLDLDIQNKEVNFI
jgi:Icc-related predicted phosphoesterase